MWKLNHVERQRKDDRCKKLKKANIFCLQQNAKKYFGHIMSRNEAITEEIIQDIMLGA